MLPRKKVKIGNIQVFLFLKSTILKQNVWEQIRFRNEKHRRF